MNVSIILILFILKDWWADNNKYLYLEMSEHLLVFPFSVAVAEGAEPEATSDIAAADDTNAFDLESGLFFA